MIIDRIKEMGEKAKTASIHLSGLNVNKRKKIKEWNDPVKVYRHMNRMYSKKSAIEVHFVSYQPQRILPSTIVEWVRKWGLRKN